MNCDRTIIAKCPFASVQACACGTVTIHCGNASMRVPRGAFLSFARMVDDAFTILMAKEFSSGKDTDGFHEAGD